MKREMTRTEAGRLITGNENPAGYGMQKAMCKITGLPYSGVHNWFRPEAKSKPVGFLLRILLALKEKGYLEEILDLAETIEIKQEKMKDER